MRERRRAVFAGLVLVFGAGCTGARTKLHVPRVHAPRPMTLCFESRQGIEVFAQEAAVCPRKDSFASDVDRVLASAGLDARAFVGLRVVYVRGGIVCSGTPTFGCSDVDRRVSYVSVDCPWPRKLTRHELGHQAVRALGLPERRQDHGDPWWNRM